MVLGTEAPAAARERPRAISCNAQGRSLAWRDRHEVAPRRPRMPDAPVSSIPTDAPARRPEPGMALCLSGGGYRAMLFHTGVLWRLYEAGVLRDVKRISSVSGGS